MMEMLKYRLEYSFSGSFPNHLPVLPTIIHSCETICSFDCRLFFFGRESIFCVSEKALRFNCYQLVNKPISICPN